MLGLLELVYSYHKLNYESSPNKRVCKEVSEMTSVFKREMKDKRKTELESTAALYKKYE